MKTKIQCIVRFSVCFILQVLWEVCRIHLKMRVGNSLRTEGIPKKAWCWEPAAAECYRNHSRKLRDYRVSQKPCPMSCWARNMGFLISRHLKDQKKCIQYFMHYWAFLSSLSGVCRVRKRWGNIIDGRLAAMTVINVSSMYKRYKNTFEKGILLLWT